MLDVNRANYGTAAWDTGVQQVSEALQVLMRDNPSEMAFANSGMRNQVAELLALTSPLMAAGGRPLQAAVTQRQGLTRGGTIAGLETAEWGIHSPQMGPYEPNPNIGPGLGDASNVSASSAAQDATANTVRRMKSLGNKSAYDMARVMKGVGARLEELWKNSRAFKFATVAGAGIMLAGALLSRGKADSEEILPAQEGMGPGAPMPRDANIALPEPGDLAPSFNAFSLPEARVQRPFGIRTHHRVEGTGTSPLMGMVQAADGMYGRPFSPVIHSGSIEDRASGQKYRHELENEIRNRARSSF
jgi:hypothetical protein